MNSPKIPESISENAKPDFKTSFESGFFLVMESSEGNFRAITADGRYSFELNSSAPGEPKYVSDLGDSSDIDAMIAGYQEKTTLQFMSAGDYPLPNPIPKEYRKLVTVESVATHLPELEALMKTQEYKGRVQSIFDTWNEE